MKKLLPFSVLVVAAACNPVAWAQTAAAPQAAASTAAAESADHSGGRSRPDSRVERIHHADSAATIDEVRVGGESQSITVKPNNSAPAYEIIPEKTTPSANRGQRMWNVLKF